MKTEIMRQLQHSAKLSHVVHATIFFIANSLHTKARYQPEDIIDGVSTAVKNLNAGTSGAGAVYAGFALARSNILARANKYTPNGWKTVEDGETRYTDAMLRHLLAEATGEIVDDESGLLHASQTAWNALARLELMLTKTKEI